MKEKLKIGLLYIAFHNILLKKFKVNSIIKRKEITREIGIHAHATFGIRDYIIQEMIEKRLLEKMNRDELKILPYDIDIETEHNKLYKMFL
jgi:predicted transcriptional regulator